MEVELLLGDVVSPGVALSIEEYPEDRERRHPDEEDRRQGDDKRVLAPLARAPFILVGVVRTAALTETI